MIANRGFEEPPNAIGLSREWNRYPDDRNDDYAITFASDGGDGYPHGTHSLRRTKVSLIYKRTGNLRAVQLLLGHTKLESTVRYLGIEVEDALAMSEQTEI